MPVLGTDNAAESFATSAEQPPRSERWPSIFTDLDVSFRPIISLTSGTVTGYESLIRGFEIHGFETPLDLFDAASADGLLPELEVAAWAIAITKFAVLLQSEQELYSRQPHLSLNIDNRSLAYPELLVAGLEHALKAAELPRSTLILDLDSRHPLYGDAVAMQGLQMLRGCFGAVALDDYGMGWSGPGLLYAIRPDYIKIDRFFVSGASMDGNRRRLFLPPIVNLAHLMTIKVVAKGVDSLPDYLFCRDAGCDFGQGWFVGDPAPGETPAGQLPAPRDEALAGVAIPSRRVANTDQALIKNETDTLLQPLLVTTSLPEVFERFRREQSASFLPVVDDHGMPLGILREHTLKGYAYSPYGKELLANRSYGMNLATFVSPCPIADVSTPVEKILSMFSAVADSDGILMTHDGRYAGFLSSSALLRIINEKNVATARDQNPLSRLPGNRVINDYLTHLMAESTVTSVIAYFDFDNFKPFNDSYGFRQGDRAISLFSNLLLRDLPTEGVFVGHIGGDDFFAGFYDMELPVASAYVRHVIERFTREVESFYNETDRANKAMHGVDRDGNPKVFPLLTCSAALVELAGNPGAATPDDLSEIIAVLKKKAKAAPNRVASTSLGIAH